MNDPKSPESNSASQADVQGVAEPSARSVRDYLVYGLSLPERALRGTAALVGGAINESAAFVLPAAFRDSRSYKMFVGQMLDMLAQDIGGVQSENAATADRTSDSADSGVTEPVASGDAAAGSPVEVENYVARKAVGSFVDLAGMATLHLSPLTILAIVSDVAYGSKAYLHELAAELKREGVIAQDSTIDSATDLLDVISRTTGDTAEILDLPPLSVDGLRRTITETRDQLAEIDPARLIPQSEIDRMWTDMRGMAERENVSMFEISSAMTLYTLNRVSTVGKGALTTIRVTGDMLDRHLFDHYWNGLGEIGRRGLYPMLADASRPYLEAVWYNFAAHRPTVTEDVVTGRAVGKIWRGFRQWWSGVPDADDAHPSTSPAGDDDPVADASGAERTLADERSEDEEPA